MYCGNSPNAPHGMATHNDQPSPPPWIMSININPPHTDAHDTKPTRKRATVFGSPLAVSEEPRPGLLFFTVPAGALLGEHTVRVATAGTNGGDEDYVSAAFTVTLVGP